MKTYTDIEQSKKLAEILPIESADMCWEAIYAYPKEDIIEYADKPTIGYIKHCLPAWSLSALFDILENPMLLKYDESWHIYNEDIKCLYFDNSIDACYEMIVELHKKGLL